MDWNGGVPDFNARQAPLALKVTTAANIATYVLLANPIALFVWGVAAMTVWAVVLTTPLRQGRSTGVTVLVVVACLVVLTALGAVVLRTTRSTAVIRLVTGRPRFWPLDSPGRRYWSSLLSCIGSVEIGCRPDEERYLRASGDREAELAMAVYRRRYVALYGEETWPQAWEQIEASTAHGVTFGEAIRSARWSLLTERFVFVLKLIPAFAVIFSGGFIWLAAGVIDGAAPLRLVQFTVLAATITAGIIYVNFTVSLRQLTISSEMAESRLGDTMRAARLADPTFDEVVRDWEADGLPESLREWEGRVIYPTIRIRDGYARSVRNLYLPRLALGGATDLCVGLLVLAAVWALSSVASDWSRPQLNEWVLQVALAAAVGPVAFCAMIAVAFFFLSWSHALMSLLVTGLFLTVIPPFVTYLLGGDVGPSAVATSVVTGAAGIASSAVVELVKKRPSAQVAG